jgi:anti-anti-sigma factor
MAGVEPPRGFAVEHLDVVTVLRFTEAELVDGETTAAIGQRMARLVDNLSHHRFVIDLGPVLRMSSAMLGKLIAFHKKVKQAGGHLALCSLTPDMHQKFHDTRLHTIFHICPNEAAALQGMGCGEARPAETFPA